jgi:Anti-sigma-28 factor, FlgM
MNNDRRNSMQELKRQIEAGEYRIDPAAVADAIVRRLHSADAGAGGRGAEPSPRATPRRSRRLRTNARIRTARRRRR